ncbi:MAG: pumilio domain member 6 [Bathelium mastoideum]|nr:MAG: pumilio domain member 6 [Bathelium mastoideum]KAI9682623.1 MAG: pumilio domain member 6 [Bathelium mastoideum]
MPGIKRKSLSEPKRQNRDTFHKKVKVAAKETDLSITSKNPRATAKSSNTALTGRNGASKARGDNRLVELNASEQDDTFGGFSNSEAEEEIADVDTNGPEEDEGVASRTKKSAMNGNGESNSKVLQDGQSSKEAHAKQKALARERKSAKPNADSIHRAKKLWERLRRKSHVPKQEREQLVAELYDIVTGRVKDFVFKHDSVRVVQCALKYANMEQRKMIAHELKGEYKTLAESRYAKFLIGKLLVEGDTEVRDLIVPEFCGHVRRMINHPEASWIIDDIYRQIATSDQKALLLREWYGAEFSIFKNPKGNSTDKPTAELSTILASSPEKRKPIMTYLFQMINQLIQKRMTAFTMLHDAMLQYYLNINPAAEEHVAFTDLLRPDSTDESDGTPDLLKNLAFTPSGSRLICLHLAHGTAKDRRSLLKVFKDTVQLMAHDPNAHTILLTAYAVVDDTREVTKTIISELLGNAKSTEQQQQSSATDASLAPIVDLATHLTARRTLLYPLVDPTSKALLPPTLQTLLQEIRAASASTSKKHPATRAAELARALLPTCLATITNHASQLLASGFGAQFIQDVLLCPHADAVARLPAAEAVAGLVGGDPRDEKHEFADSRPWAGRMLAGLVRGGRFNRGEGEVVKGEGWTEMGFPQMVWKAVREEVVAWAVGGSSFVVVNLMEVAEEEGGLREEERDELVGRLKEEGGLLEEAARDADGDGGGKKRKSKGGEGKEKAKGREKGNVGAKMILEKLR